MATQTNSNKGNIINVTREFDTKYFLKDGKAFAKFVRDKLNEYNENYGEDLKTRDLAKRVGINYEMFRKILNRQKPTSKRDFFIAIGVVLHWTPGEIDEALIRYQYIPTLDNNNPRDAFIMLQIKSDISVSDLNDRLIRNGFPELDIHDKRGGKKEITEEKESHAMSYKVMESRVRTPVSSDYYYGDQYNSLCTTYNPFRCKSTGDMVIKDLNTKRYIHLTVHSDGGFYSQVIYGDNIPRHYENIEDTGTYKDYFLELNRIVLLEKERLLTVLNDTKNYKVRTSARLIGGAIIVFSEEFNYTIPELNEYYMMTRSKGKYKLLVYHQSAFMCMYLSEDEFKKYYGITNSAPVETYDSIKQIEDMLVGKNTYSEEAIRLRMRKRTFVRMQKNVDELYGQLKAKKKFIQNLDFIYENPYDVLRYYSLEKDYECQYDEEYSEIVGCLNSKEYVSSDGTKVEITLEDIKHAFELSYENINQICELKAKLGSVEAVL